MRETQVTIPELGLIAATRALLGAGIGLLLAERFSDAQRKAIGWTLVFVGAASTVPLAYEVLSKQSLTATSEKADHEAADTMCSRMGNGVQRMPARA